MGGTPSLLAGWILTMCGSPGRTLRTQHCPTPSASLTSSRRRNRSSLRRSLGTAQRQTGTLMLQSRQDLIPGQIFVRNVICRRIYAKLKPDNLIRNRHIITVDNEGKQTEQDMAQDLKLPFNIQVNVTYAKKTFFCQIILTIVLSTQRIPSVWVDACSLVCIAR